MRSNAKKFAVALLGTLVWSCGDNQSSPSTGSTGGGAATADVSGNVVGSPTRSGAPLLVFLYADLGEGADPAGREPTSLGNVGSDGRFSLSAVPDGPATLVFLRDDANDGFVDAGDPVAILGDPSRQLAALRAGDRVTLSDVQLDFEGRRAVAAGVEVLSSAAPPPTSTPAPAN